MTNMLGTKLEPQRTRVEDGRHKIAEKSILSHQKEKGLHIQN